MMKVGIADITSDARDHEIHSSQGINFLRQEDRQMLIKFTRHAEDVKYFCKRSAKKQNFKSCSKKYFIFLILIAF